MSKETTANELHNVDVYDVPETTARTGRIAYVGPSGSHAERALALHLGCDPREIGERGLACRDVSDALHAVRDGQVDHAIVPWRNALGGSVHETLDGVLDEDLSIVAAHLVPVRLCLAALESRPIHELRVVRSHPEALRQCRKLLRRMPGARREPAASTAAAARALRAASGTEGSDDIGILCSPRTADQYGLRILVEAAADHPENRTRFVVVARAEGPAGTVAATDAAPNRTALVMATAHRHGALARCLTALADRRVQLTHLESRPLPGRPWEVQFAVEAEGSPDVEPLRTALDELRQQCTHLKVLGAWHDPQAAQPQPQVRIEVEPSVEPMVEPVDYPERPKRLVDAHPDRPRTVVHVGDAVIGGDDLVLIGGPCSVESREQVHAVAAAIAAAGGKLLRGGAFKPRSSPYSFQGLGEEGLRLLAEAGKAHGLPVVTEVMRPEQLQACCEYADMLQVGARNMQNFSLLAEIGAARRPVLLKRGMSATIEELLNAAEYILARGNTQVVLCERGIRTFETATRSTLDLSAIPVLLERTHLPVIVDPSHAAGVRRYVAPLSRAARAIGAHGLIVEVHPEPAKALSDGPQALTLPMWRALAAELRQ